jgi:hypothetical protein
VRACVCVHTLHTPHGTHARCLGESPRRSQVEVLVVFVIIACGNWQRYAAEVLRQHTGQARRAPVRPVSLTVATESVGWPRVGRDSRYSRYGYPVGP